jgi:hypothetical protein
MSLAACKIGVKDSLLQRLEQTWFGTHRMRLHVWLACLGDKALRHAWLGTRCSSVIDIVSEESWSRFVAVRAATRAIWPYSCELSSTWYAFQERR